MPILRFTFLDKDNIHTLHNFLTHKLTLSKKRAKQLLDKRRVFVNKRRIWIASYRLNKGDVVEVITEEIKSSDFPSGHTTGTGFQKDSILFKDDHYLIVSKPPNIVTNGPKSLESELRMYFHDDHIQAVHRLDKDTSGVVIFAMKKDAFERMKALFKEEHIKKVYRAIVRGSISKQNFTIDTPIRKQRAATHAKLLKGGKDASYLEVQIETGRTHQIRIHLASIGYPVIGEMEYDRKPIESPLLRQIGRHMLHAYLISFIHPYTHKTVSVTADIPEDFYQCLKLFGLE